MTCRKLLIKNICDQIFECLSGEEVLNISVSGEETQFIRFNNAKIRQAMNVEQYELNLFLIKNNKKLNFKCMLSSWDLDNAIKAIKLQLARARSIISHMPEDPFIVTTQNSTSEELNQKEMLDGAKVCKQIIECAEGQDFCGLYTGGTIYRGFFNNLGVSHWFSTTLNQIDYSIYAAKQRAVKGGYSSSEWKQADFIKSINKSKDELKLMSTDWHQLERGKYRCYLAPDALNEILSMLNWNGLSYQSYKQGSSSLKKLAEGKNWSSKFNLVDDLSTGTTPRFNMDGEFSQDNLSIIKSGKLDNFLINSRSAKEYNVESNLCDSSEGLRCTSVATGELAEADILKKLGTGLYLSNLHYLNWSDLNNARVTGMTRFACFWVENGEIVAPIKEMRFDDELYHVFGDGLEALTSFSKQISLSDTYFQRNVGVSKVPGAVVNDFSITL
jgi:predicted Zn-dependent protease